MAQQKLTLPGWLKPANRIIVLLQRMGLAFFTFHLMSLRGRRTGKVRTTPVSAFTVDGRRYVLSVGETEWVRNARAARQGVISRGRRHGGWHSCSLGTGLVLVLLEKGGLRQAWILIKLCLQLGILATGALFIAPILQAAPRASDLNALYRDFLILLMAVQAVMLLTATALAVFKPSWPRPRPSSFENGQAVSSSGHGSPSVRPVRSPDHKTP